MFSRYGIAAILSLLIGLGAVGCAGYRLGPTNDQVAGHRSIAISPVINNTLEPRLGDAATAALRKEIQRDGTFQLRTDGFADLVVKIELRQFDRGEVSFLPGDVIVARDYRISLTAHVVAVDRSTGRVVVERDATGITLMRVGSDLPSAERQMVPVLATDLARRINSLLAEGGW